MKLKKAIVAMALCLSLIFPAIGALAFDKEPGTFKEFTQEGVEYVDISTSVVKITTLGSVLTHYPVWNQETYTFSFVEAVGIFQMSGSGFLVEGKNGKLYIITAAHVVEPEGGIVQEDLSFYYAEFGPTVEILNRSIFIGDGCTATVVYVDKEKDIALLELDGYWPAAKPLPYDLAYTSESRTPIPLEEGDTVAVVVRERDEEDGSQIDWRYEVRYGTVVAPFVHLPAGSPDYNLPWFSMNDFTTDMIILPGDSGSPVFAFEKGKPVLVGIARAYAWNAETGEVLFYVARLDVIKQIIDGRQ